MPFNSDIRHFKDAAALAEYLRLVQRPDWPGNAPRGSTYHNTYRPLPSQWVGQKSVEAMRKGYIAKGWSSGPHLYLVLGCPRPSDAGIWQLTPLTSPGTHAGECNPVRFGIEVVGDYDKTAPSLPLQRLLIDTLTVIHSWAGIGPDLNAHRDCMPGRTCPGDAFYSLKPALQKRLAERLLSAGTYRATHPAAIFETPTMSGPVALGGAAEVARGELVEIDEVKGGAAHLRNGVGFLPIAILERFS